MRRDVMSLANKLSVVSGFDSESVYTFLMNSGKHIGKNPCFLPFKAIDGMIYLDGDIYNFRLEKYVPPKKWEPTYNGPDYEQLILARQEKWMD